MKCAAFGHFVGLLLVTAASCFAAIGALQMDASDHLEFSTWNVYSTRNLPETSLDAFTHLIDYYFDHR
jgi:hypothetical protein